MKMFKGVDPTKTGKQKTVKKPFKSFMKEYSKIKQI